MNLRFKFIEERGMYANFIYNLIRLLSKYSHPVNFVICAYSALGSISFSMVVISLLEYVITRFQKWFYCQYLNSIE